MGFTYIDNCIYIYTYMGFDLTNTSGELVETGDILPLVIPQIALEMAHS